jgi:alkylation response protein AidB-like acyl-CoA dehydrogenase
LSLFGNDEQKEEIPAGFGKGKKVAAFAVTEPEAGFNASGIKTTAKKEAIITF